MSLLTEMKKATFMKWRSETLIPSQLECLEDNGAPKAKISIDGEVFEPLAALMKSHCPAFEEDKTYEVPTLVCNQPEAMVVLLKFCRDGKLPKVFFYQSKLREVTNSELVACLNLIQFFEFDNIVEAYFRASILERIRVDEETLCDLHEAHETLMSMEDQEDLINRCHKHLQEASEVVEVVAGHNKRKLVLTARPDTEDATKKLKVLLTYHRDIDGVDEVCLRIKEP